jgi:hypothetical protein
MKTTNASQQKKRRTTKEDKAYEKPAIIHESQITTRAGTPIEGADPDRNGVDPADLFGG